MGQMTEIISNGNDQNALLLLLYILFHLSLTISLCNMLSDMEEETFFTLDSDLDCSFTSLSSTASTERTLPSSAASSFSARSSYTTTSIAGNPTHICKKPHRSSDPHWSSISTATRLSHDGSLHLHHLKLIRHLGSGNLARVYLCRLKDAPSGDKAASFALKVVDRDAIPEKKLTHVKTEAELLSSFDHPFLPTLYARVEASHYTCLLIDYCPGGDLHSLLGRQPENRLPLSSVRFYAAEVLVALEYLHALGVVYRDLKPENVLRRADGHVMLSDFDLSFRAHVDPILRKRKVGPKKGSCFGVPATNGEDGVTEMVAEPSGAYSRACVGTHEYLAPEIVGGNGHGNGVDWWAFGVFVYEMLYGVTPFKGACKEETLRNIATRELRFPRAGGVAGEEEAAARDLIGRLLVKNPSRRLGCAGGATDIKRHPFFKEIKWPLIRCYQPPRDGHVSGRCGRRRWKGLGVFCKKRSHFGLKFNSEKSERLEL